MAASSNHGHVSLHTPGAAGLVNPTINIGRQTRSDGLNYRTGYPEYDKLLELGDAFLAQCQWVAIVDPESRSEIQMATQRVLSAMRSVMVAAEITKGL